MSKFQRALWTFLYFTLVAPILAAIIAAIATPLLIWANLPPFTAGDHTPYDWSNLPSGGTLMPFLGQMAVRTYIWCAIPAALTAVTLIPHILRKGTVGWLEAVVGGALCFAAASVVLGLQHGGALVYMCFASAIVALICWAILRKAGVLPVAEPPVKEG